LSAPLALALISAYVVGSIGFARLFGRLHGIEAADPIGPGDLLRRVGWGPAAMAVVGDVFKGLVAAAMGTVASGRGDAAGVWAFAVGAMAVVGDCYPLFYRFHGSRGVAPLLGVLLFTVPLAGVVALAFWAVLAALRVPEPLGIALPAIAIVLALWQGVGGASLGVLIVTCALVAWRHRSSLVPATGPTER
jgi:glycerol-3-phosphate acyltransferase PlsY